MMVKSNFDDLGVVGLLDNFDEWLKDLGLLHHDRKCPYGDHEMKLPGGGGVLHKMKSAKLNQKCTKKL